MSKIPMLITTGFIVLSGIQLSFSFDIHLLLFIKIICASLLIYGFFNCPFFMKEEECEIRRFMYRFGIVILLIITILLGLYI